MKEQAAIVIRKRRYKVLGRPRGKIRNFLTGNPNSLTSLL